MSIATREYGLSERKYSELDLFYIIVEDLSREDRWFSVEDKGYFKYNVVDNAGSIVIDYKPRYSNEYNEAIMKVYLYGTDKGAGCFYTKLEKGMFRKKEEFNTYEEVRVIMLKYLENMI